MFHNVFGVSSHFLVKVIDLREWVLNLNFGRWILNFGIPVALDSSGSSSESVSFLEMVFIFFGFAIRFRVNGTLVRVHDWVLFFKYLYLTV